MDIRMLKGIILLIILAGSVGYLVSTGMKLVFAVPRPCAGTAGCQTDYSFPSREATIAAGVASALSLFLRRKSAVLILSLLTAAVGYWRIASGEHTIYDVFGGFAFGAAVGFAVYYYFRKFHGVRAHRK